MIRTIRQHLAGSARFTLIELMIAVATISMLAAVAGPNFISYRDRSRVVALIATGNSVHGGLSALAAEDATSFYPTKLDFALLNAGGSRIPTSDYTLDYTQAGTPTGASSVSALTHTATGLRVCIAPESIRKMTD